MGRLVCCRCSLSLVLRTPIQRQRRNSSWVDSLEEVRTYTKKKPWSIVLFLNGKPTKFEIDTGVEVTVISERAHQNIGSPKLHLLQKTLQGPSNQELSVKSQFTAKLKNSDREVEQELFVVKDLHRHLLGHPAIQALDLAARVRAVREDEKSPVAHYPNLFTGLGKVDREKLGVISQVSKPTE